MYVFRHAATRCTVRNLVLRVERALHGVHGEAPLRLLLAAGALECSLADLWGQERDQYEPGNRAALALSLAAASHYLRSLRAAPVEAPSVARCLDRLRPWLPPPGLPVVERHAEGLRYYALLPRDYIEPARRLARALAGESVFVIGLRTIGSTLAPVVAAELRAAGCAARILTLRPRGAPEDRAYAASAEIEQALHAFSGAFAIVDEGPGLSGSSFGGAVSFLGDLGIEAARITLMPSWNPPAASLSHTVVAHRWDQWRKFPARPVMSPSNPGQDLSAGKWRRIFAPRRAIPVWPQQERAKFLSADGRFIFKFAGLGDSVGDAVDRSRLLARHGFSPLSASEGEGWLRYPFVSALPLLRPNRAWGECAGRYLAFIAAQFTSGAAAPPAPELHAMAQTNIRLLIGRDFSTPPPEGHRVRLDGRMLPQEWAICDGGFVKFDSLDHGDDHFFPGPADIAWDLASLEIEFGASARAAREEYVRRSGDAAIRQRLPWYRLAYAAFRAAFAEFARELVADPDRGWFRRQRDCYLAYLRRGLPPSPEAEPRASAATG